MDTRERLALEYDYDHEPKLLTFPARASPRPPLHWNDVDICVCGVLCKAHWNLRGDWLGCTAAKDNER